MRSFRRRRRRIAALALLPFAALSAVTGVALAATIESNRQRPRLGPAATASRAAPDARRATPGRHVHRRMRASWYGPGLYGGRLACGGRLSPRTEGVAHRSLRCGRRLTLRYRGRRVRVAVVDRGPHVAGRELDLTAATARRLRFTGVDAVLAKIQ